MSCGTSPLGSAVGELSPQPAGDGEVVDVHAPVEEPALQLGGRAPRVVQREQFEGVAVESRNGEAAAPPGAGLLPQARGLGDRVEGLAAAGTGQGSGHPAGRGSGRAVVAGKDGARMGTRISHPAWKRNYPLFIKFLRRLPRRLRGTFGRLAHAGETRIRCARRTAGMASVGRNAALDALDPRSCPEEVAVAIPTGSVGGVPRPVKGVLRRRHPSLLTGRSAPETAAESVRRAKARRPQPTRLLGGS